MEKVASWLSGGGGRPEISSHKTAESVSDHDRGKMSQSEMRKTASQVNQD